MDNYSSIPNELKLYKVKYEGEAFVFAESVEDAIAKYKTDNVQIFEKATGTSKVATYKGEE